MPDLLGFSVVLFSARGTVFLQKRGQKQGISEKIETTMVSAKPLPLLYLVDF
jgi:hypothetical protein